MLTEVNRFPDAALPLEACKAHLRMGSGFADEGGQDGLVAQYLRAAILAVERRIGKVLIARSFRLRRTAWRDGQREVLPVAPVREITSVMISGRDGTATVIDPALYRLQADGHRPCLVPTGWLLPGIPHGGTVEVVFEAGFGPQWQDVPADLAQAVMLLAAQYHEGRMGLAGGEAAGAMPFGILALIEGWRDLRVSATGDR